MASTSSSADAAAATSWFYKIPNDMSMKELKLAIGNAGLRGESEGFVEKSEFISLLNSYLNDVHGQDECPVCFMPLNFGMKSTLLSCKHRLCEDCLYSIVTRDDISCSCPLCRASVSKTSLAIGMKGASLAVKMFFAGYDGADRNELRDETESQLRESLRQDPRQVVHLTTLADIIIEKGGDPVEAGMLCRRAIYFEPTNYVGFTSLGNVYKSIDDYGAASHCYEKALSLSENNANIMTVLGNLYADNGNIVEALKLHRRAAEINPDDLMVVFSLGLTLEEANIDVDEAISLFKRALSLDEIGSDEFPPGAFYEPISAAMAVAMNKKRSQLSARR